MGAITFCFLQKTMDFCSILFLVWEKRYPTKSGLISCTFLTTCKTSKSNTQKEADIYFTAHLIKNNNILLALLQRSNKMSTKEPLWTCLIMVRTASFVAEEHMRNSQTTFPLWQEPFLPQATWSGRLGTHKGLANHLTWRNSKILQSTR